MFVSTASHDVRAGDVQDLVAALETVEVVRGEVDGLKQGAVSDDNAVHQRFQQRRLSAIAHGPSLR
ncbi:hypothetical protein ACIRG5_09245 [Lentzea sp. NPDC102401]|uniref:hypothetical protein n=1 Tax=Lentzea sp. NPDC102401 TaxID=3364128 RepID=UPI0038186EF9